MFAQKNVITEIVRKNLCIGCGVCIAMCPKGCLSIKSTDHGDFKPYSLQKCLKNCKRCLQVCPFYHGNINENKIGFKHFGQIPSIKFLDPLGYYSNTYAGYVLNKERRQKSSSGGLASWLLIELIMRGIVDYVVCVKQVQNSMLFRFKICKTFEEIFSCSGSHYCPVESSSVLSKIKKQSGRYAFIGLPCQLKALRLATEQNKVLRQRIVIFVGLTCGQLKTMNYTRYLKSLTGICDEQTKIKYREKIKGVAVNNYCFTTTNKAGRKSKLFFSDGPHEAWVNRWFTPNPCNYCDDIFAEVADISLMDAWMPQYIKNEKGTNFLIIRSPVLKEIFENGLYEKSIYIEQVVPSDLLKSQEGVFLYKHRQLAYRLYLLKKKFGITLNKRINSKRSFNFFIIYENYLKEKMQTISQTSFLKNFDSPNNILDLKMFRNDLWSFLYRIKLLNTLKKFNIVKRVFIIIKKKLLSLYH